jgi:uncharacterized membrane protein HdeD (DUF308 family)
MESTTTETTAAIDGSRGAVVGGVLIAVLGLVAIFFPFVTGLSLSLLLGGVLVIGALVHVAHAFGRGRSLGSRIWQVALGIIYGAAGIALLANPVLGLVTLTLLVIAFFVVDGLVEIVWAIGARGQGGSAWLLASGILSLAVAGLLWVGFPTTAIWAVGVLFGVNLLATGVAMAVVGRRASPVRVDAETPTGG